MEGNSASVKAFQTIVRFFDEANWKVSRHDDRQTLVMGVTAKNGRYQCFVHVRREYPVVIMYCVAGVRVPDEKLASMAEFITRANYGLCVGNFEMDYSDGELRYKTSLDIRDGELTTDMVKILVHANVTTLDRYFPGMLEVLSGNGSPEAAVGKIEKTFFARMSQGSTASSRQRPNEDEDRFRSRFPWLSS